MRARTSLPGFLFAIVLAGLMSFGLGPSRALAGVGTAADVSNIGNQVQHNLAMLPWYGVFDNLQYQVNGTEVILTGQVVSEHAITKDSAEKAVGSIPGVTNVV